MTLIKTSILSFISTAIKMLAGLAINKAVAVYIGPSGLAIIGQFQNFMQLTMTAAKGGINSGVTKYTAEYGIEGEQLTPLLSTAGKISVACSLFVGVGMMLLAKPASLYFLNSNDYSYVFIVFGITISFFVINQLLLSIINGLKEVTVFIAINITQSVYSLIFTTLLIVMFGLNGALIALVTNQSVVFVSVLWRLRHHAVIKFERFKQAFDWQQAKKLFRYSAMALTSAATVPVSHLIIRNYLGENLSWEQAGYWQAMWYISSMYLMVVTTALSIYYLPRLSEITDRLELRKELLTGYKLIMPIVIVMSVSIYLLKDIIIWLLFTEDFLPMRELFAWQLIGDVVKLASWLLAYLMLAKAMTRLFIITEIVFSVLFVSFSVLFVSLYGLVGVTYAYFINYSLYFLLMLYLFRKSVSK